VTSDEPGSGAKSQKSGVAEFPPGLH
jgi:hypothetical protein